MKKSLGSLILSFLLFGSITLKTNNGMEVRDVLSNDISKTVTGEVVRTKRADENEVKEVADVVKVQQRENLDGTHDMRFVAGITSVELNNATFNITIDNGSKQATKSYEITRAYTHIMIEEEVLTAASVFGEGYDYLVAYTINGIPKKAIEYTYSVNVSICDDEGVVDTSQTRDIVLKEITDLDLNVKNGSFKWEDGKYIATADYSLAICQDLSMANGTLSTTLTKSTGFEDSGIIFGVTYNGEELNSYWEGAGVSYYYFFVNLFNGAYLAKSDNGAWVQLGRIEFISNYSEGSDYPLSVSFENGYISCFVGDQCLIKYQDSNPLTGTGVGYRAQKEGTCYTDLVVSETVRKDTRDVIDGYTVAYGNAQLNGNTIKTTSGNTILVDENTRMADGKMYTTKFKPTVSQDAGIIIGLKDAGYRTFWEESWTQMEYYFFFINFGGILIVSKVGSTTDAGVWTTVADNNNIKDFDPNKTYELGVSVEGTTFKCYVDGMLVHTYNTNRELAGNMLGFRAAIAGAEYSAFETKDTPTSESLEWYQRSGSFVKDETGALTSYCNGSLAWVNNRSLTTGSFQVDITASEASDTGIIFGNSDPVATRWEERPYYFFFVNFGNDAILAGPVNGWTTFATGGNVADKLNPYGTPNTLKVEIKENYNIVCYVNGHEVINTTISDSSLQLTGTYFGVRCVGNGLRKFENFVIENA